MALINGNRSSQKEKIKIELNSETLKQIQSYCTWAGIENIEFFIEEAAHFVFVKDKEWKQKKKSAKKAAKEIAK